MDSVNCEDIKYKSEGKGNLEQNFRLLVKKLSLTPLHVRS